jgi:hypothetical protein
MLNNSEKCRVLGLCQLKTLAFARCPIGAFSIDLRDQTIIRPPTFQDPAFRVLLVLSQQKVIKHPLIEYFCAQPFPLLFRGKVEKFSGLIDPGCLCYMNSVLQQLCGNHDFFSRLVHTNPADLRADLQVLRSLFAHMRLDPSARVPTTDYIEQYSRFHREFHPTQQEDAIEYFQSVLDTAPPHLAGLAKGSNSTFIKHLVTK